MTLPDDVHQLFMSFYPGSRDASATLDEWIASVVEHLSAERKKNIKAFLDELLSDRHSDAEIAETWRSASPSYDFADGGHRIFLSQVRDMVR